jgi:hypothetical protein
MTGELYTDWLIGLGIAALIVIIAAALLIAVWSAARRILRLAEAALGLVVQVKDNTQSIWELENTNDTAQAILQGAENIEKHAGAVAEALHEADQQKSGA